MFRKKFLLFSVLLAVSGFTFISCATKAIGVRQDSSFKKAAIVKGKMAVGGVASSIPLSDGEATSYANSLKDQIQEKRSDLSVAPSGVVADKLGSEGYKSMLAEYGEKGVLGAARIKELVSKVDGIRYVIFARIDTDAIEKNRAEKSTKDKEGKVISSRIVATVTRKVSVSFNVYDTEQGIVAWSGTIETTKKSSEEYRQKKGVNIVDIIKAVKSKGDAKKDDPYPFPEPPNLKNILADNFKGFAKQMPK